MITRRFIARYAVSWIGCLLLWCLSGCAGLTSDTYLPKRVSESFDASIRCDGAWSEDPVLDHGPFSEGGKYFASIKDQIPQAYRQRFTLGKHRWLTAELYTRDAGRQACDMVAVVVDPTDPNNQVLRVESFDHTDGVIIRSSEPLSEHYTVKVRVGFPQFGTGSGMNGYSHGDEQAEPWLDASAVLENGFYWFGLLDTQPLPHNNIWLHHHRKFVIDSDNHYPVWMEIFDGNDFVESGKHPVMVFAIDGKGGARINNGRPFLAYSNQQWQPSGAVRAVDAYLSDTWYSVEFTRTPTHYHFTIEGEFYYGGHTTYRGSIEIRENCVYHHNQPNETVPEHCIDESYFSELGQKYKHWPADRGYPDYLFVGDPHINYYEGSVLYDDFELIDHTR